MQLSDLKLVYAEYLVKTQGQPPKICQMGSLLFEEFREFVDPVMDECEKYSIPVKPRRYMWKNVEVVLDETLKPFKFKFE